MVSVVSSLDLMALPYQIVTFTGFYNRIYLSVFHSLYPLMKLMEKYSSIMYHVHQTRKRSPFQRSLILNTRQKYSLIKMTTLSVWWQKILLAHRHLLK